MELAKLCLATVTQTEMDQTLVSKSLETESPGEEVTEGGSCEIQDGRFEKQIHISLVGATSCLEPWFSGTSCGRASCWPDLGRKK